MAPAGPVPRQTWKCVVTIATNELTQGDHYHLIRIQADNNLSGELQLSLYAQKPVSTFPASLVFGRVDSCVVSERFLIVRVAPDLHLDLGRDIIIEAPETSRLTFRWEPVAQGVSRLYASFDPRGAKGVVTGSFDLRIRGGDFAPISVSFLANVHHVE